MNRQKQSTVAVEMILVAAALCMTVLGGANALFADEAGQSDFLKQTAGHGGPLTLAASGASSSLITSTASSPSNLQALSTETGEYTTSTSNNPCYIASRNVEDGALLWRRNVCTTSAGASSAAVGVAMTPDNTHILTVDGTSGIVQKWSSANGELLWNSKAPLPEGGEAGDISHNGAMARVFSFDEHVFAVTAHDALPSDDNSKRHQRNGQRHTELLSVFTSSSVEGGAEGGDVMPFEYESPGRHKETSTVTGISAGQLLDDHTIKMSSVSSEQKSSPRFVNVFQHNVGVDGKPQLFVVAAHVPAESTVTALSQIGVFQIDYDDLVVNKKWSVVESWCMKDVLGRHGAAFLDVSTLQLVAPIAGSLSGLVVKKHPAPSPGHDEVLAFGLVGAGNQKPHGMAKYEWTAGEDGSAEVIESITAVADESTSSGSIIVQVKGSKSSAIVKYSNGGSSFDVLAGRKASVMPSVTLTKANCASAVKGGTSMIHIRATGGGLLDITKVSGDTVDVAREETVRRAIPFPRDHDTDTPFTHLFSATCSSPSVDGSESSPANAHVDLVLGSGVDGSTTAVVRVTLDDSFSISTLFQAEEALASIQSTIVMDVISHVVVPVAGDGDDDEDAIPSLATRLLLQASGIPLLAGMLVTPPLSEDTSAISSSSSRDVSFGFKKTIVALTSNGQLYGLDTQRKGQVIWSLDVDVASGHSHALVYSGKDHGSHHAHSHEFLVVSQAESSNELMWKCVDGIHGKIIKEGSIVKDKKGIAQMGPVRLDHHGHGSMGCYQQAMVLYEDGSVDLVPSTPAGTEALNELLTLSGGAGVSSPFYMHSVDRSAGALRSVKVVSDNSVTGPTCTAEDGNGECLSGSDNIFSSLVVGETLFSPTKERIVNVAYPNPEEVVQRPVTILGDDSLLLKYLNPHLAVIVTEATPQAMQELQVAVSASAEGDLDLISALAEGDSSIFGSAAQGSKKKPAGATPVGAGDADAATASFSMMPKEAPSLFINVVDTVAGKLLYRVSHTTAATTPTASSRKASRGVPVTISENWIVYSFWNDKSKRTEVGSITLHEGMIEKHGLTAFQGLPEDETTKKFTSLESARPIVLSRTFSLSKEVLAMGFTQTARGISSKQLVLALGNGQIATIDRRFLDPRRPSGEPKPEEKLEGLFRYSPVLPIMPQKVASYYHAVEGVTHVACAAAHIESQTFVLAYGGPDLFMARVAPSKGFDLLPENFSKGLLSVVVLGLLCVTATVQSMSQKKLTSVVWS